MLAFVYLIVVPSLEDRLVDSRKDQVGHRRRARRRASSSENPADRDALADGFASASNTRVTFFEISSREPADPASSIADEGGGRHRGRDRRRSDRAQQPRKDTRRRRKASVTRADREFAEAAHPPTDANTSSSSRARSRTR